MKKIFTIAVVLMSIVANGQDLKYQPYFSAVVVKDLATSVKWYQSVFNLKVKTEMKDTNGNYHIIILESPDYLLELLELKGSLVKEDILKGKSQETRLQGHFKVGFKITDANNWLKHLKDLHIEVPNSWTDQATGKKNFLINDPDQNLIQFFE